MRATVRLRKSRILAINGDRSPHYRSDWTLSPESSYLCLPSAEHGVGDEGLDDPFDRHRRHGHQLEARVELLAHRSGEQDVAAMLARERLHARGEVQGGADHRVLAPVAAADEAGEPRPTVDADTDGDARQPRTLEFGVVEFQRGTDRERRLYRVVALPGVRLQRAEEDEDAVAEKGTDAPTVLGDAVADELEVAVQHTCQRLRIEPLGERRVAHQVGEHGGKNLVLGAAFRPL